LFIEGNAKIALQSIKFCKQNAIFSFDSQSKILALRGGAAVRPVTPENALTLVTVIGGVSALEMLFGRDFNLSRFWGVPTHDAGAVVKALGRPFGAYLLGFSLLLYVFRDAIGITTALQVNMATQFLHLLTILYDKFITKILDNNEKIAVLTVLLLLQLAAVL